MQGRKLLGALVFAATMLPAHAADTAPAPAAAPAAAPPAAPAAAAEPVGNPDGAAEKRSMCIGCHGIQGYRTSYPAVYPVPKLGGQYPEYIVRALQAYKSGDRSHPTMQGIAAGLSDQDMLDLAAHYGVRR